MKYTHFFLIALLLKAALCQAQKQPTVNVGMDIGAGFENSSLAPSIFYHEDLSVRGLHWLQFGVGIRAAGYYTGATDLLSTNDAISSDTLRYNRLSANTISFVAGMNLRFWKLNLGFNTDLVNLAFGERRSGFYLKRHLPADSVTHYNQFVPTIPAVFNFMPVATPNQNGISEVYARVWLSRKIGLKMAYLFGRQTYTTRINKKSQIVLDNGQRRFSTIYKMPYLAICFSLL
ncbi:hypothetical protein [Dyadobacter sediminis]|nr:hypothetical protein [Dyadobacter sediminis]